MALTKAKAEKESLIQRPEMVFKGDIQKINFGIGTNVEYGREKKLILLQFHSEWPLVVYILHTIAKTIIKLTIHPKSNKP